jgi:hypothetical protein
MLGMARAVGRKLQCRRLCFVVVALAPVLAAGPAQAQGSEDAERAVARKLGYDGIELYQAGSHAEAFDKLDKAYHILEVPTLGLWSARALVQLGRLVEASERLLRIERHELPDTATDVHRKAKEDARIEREALLPRLAGLSITLEGVPADTVQVTLDGKALSSAVVGSPLPLDPGTHELVATRGEDVQQRSITVAEGEATSATLTFEPLPEPEPVAPPIAPVPTPGVTPAPAPLAPPPPEPPTDPWPIVGWVGVGLGSAGVIAGFVTGGIAASDRAKLDDDCVDSVCDLPFQDDVDRYNQLRHVSTGTFIAGSVLLSAGILTLVLAPSPDEQTSIGLTPGGAQFRGRF